MNDTFFNIPPHVQVKTFKKRSAKNNMDSVYLLTIKYRGGVVLVDFKLLPLHLGQEKRHCHELNTTNTNCLKIWGRPN